MEITLEKIELVKDRTGVTYKEAKDALEAADGSVVDAIINIEEQTSANAADDKSNNFTDSELFAKIKEIISKGNVSKITIKSKNDDVILNLPLNVGVLGAIVAPWGVIFGAIAAAGFNCKVEFVNDKGEVTDINGKVMKTYEKAVQSGQETIEKFRDSDFYNTAKEKTGETIDRIKDSEFYADVKEKTGETFDKLRDKEFYADIKERGQQTYEELKTKGQEAYEGFRNKTEDFFQDFNKEEEPAADVAATMQEATPEFKPEFKLEWDDNIGDIKQYGADLFKRLDGEEVEFGESKDPKVDDELTKFIEKLEEDSDFSQE